MTSSETLIESLQITTLADIPIEFWVAAIIQLVIPVIVFWLLMKIPSLIVKFRKHSEGAMVPSEKPPVPTSGTILTSSIDDDFADIIDEMRKERDHA